MGDGCLSLHGDCLDLPCRGLVLMVDTGDWFTLLSTACASISFSGTSWIVTWLMRLTGMVARRGPLDFVVLGETFLLSF